MHLRHLFGQHTLAIAEEVGRERHIAELGPGLGVRERIGLHAGAVVDQQDRRALAGDLVIIRQIAFELCAVVAVLDPLLLHLGACGQCGECQHGGRYGDADWRHGRPPLR